MAGSWRHMITETGKLRSNERFTGMIENLGDAYEAAEECYGMIWYLAAQLAEIEDPAGQPMRARILRVIAEAEQHYEDGLRRGGVQRDR